MKTVTDYSSLHVAGACGLDRPASTICWSVANQIGPSKVSTDSNARTASGGVGENSFGMRWGTGKRAWLRAFADSGRRSPSGERLRATAARR